MLEAIDQTKPVSVDEAFLRLFTHRDIVARCPQTGAYLEKSRAQYILCIEALDIYRHWSRRTVNFEMALERANKVVAKVQEKDHAER